MVIRNGADIRADIRRKRLLRELQELAELATMPAISTSRTLSAEVKEERAKVLGELRDLPLAD